MKLGQARWIVLIALAMTSMLALGQEKRKIIIDQDAAGPAGTDQQSILLLIQSPQTEVLGITVVTGDAWLKSEVAHTLRTLELIGRTDIPVVPGAEYPLVRRKRETELWEQRFGSIAWVGAWTPRVYHPPDELGQFPEGKPTTKPSDEDAAHFLVRMVHKFPGEVTIYEGGPMTNLALAISIDPEFPKLARELIFMGASLNPQTDDPEFANTPNTDPLINLKPTPSQKATIKYFFVVAALWLLQIALGAITAHYGVEGQGFYGFNLSKYLPYTIARTWHLQIAIFWIATSWLATGLYIAPAVGGGEPKGQRLGVNILFGALVAVVGGSLAGEYLGIQQKLGNLWFWFGSQGYEYVDLGRVWQILLFGGLVFWLWLMYRALAPALKKRDENFSLLTMFVISAIAMAPRTRAR